MPGRGAWYSASNNEEPGLRFECTQCGNCCSGPSGYVLFTETEGRAIADSLGKSYDEFLDEYTHETTNGRSLNEMRTRRGYDCVFLLRDDASGKALCSIYEVRPTQCRTWPFWKRNLASPRTWADAARTCPGLGTGALHTPEQIELTRERSPL